MKKRNPTVQPERIESKPSPQIQPLGSFKNLTTQGAPYQWVADQGQRELA